MSFYSEYRRIITDIVMEVLDDLLVPARWVVTLLVGVAGFVAPFGLLLKSSGDIYIGTIFFCFIASALSASICAVVVYYGFLAIHLSILFFVYSLDVFIVIAILVAVGWIISIIFSVPIYIE